MEDDQKAEAIQPLCDVLTLREFLVQTDKRVATDNGPLLIPLAVEVQGTEVWVDVRHPLVDRGHFDSELLHEAELSMHPHKVVDSYTLRHDLPEAFEKVTKP